MLLYQFRHTCPDPDHGGQYDPDSVRIKEPPDSAWFVKLLIRPVNAITGRIFVLCTGALRNGTSHDTPGRRI